MEVIQPSITAYVWSPGIYAPSDDASHHIRYVVDMVTEQTGYNIAF
jgi:hypothetical protein